jgi:hypothetical protein
LEKAKEERRKKGRKRNNFCVAFSLDSLLSRSSPVFYFLVFSRATLQDRHPRARAVKCGEGRVWAFGFSLLGVTGRKKD